MCYNDYDNIVKEKNYALFSKATGSRTRFGVRFRLAATATQYSNLECQSNQRPCTACEAYKFRSAQFRVDPIDDISPLSSLTNLKYLNLYPFALKDVTPLFGMTKLEQLSAFE